MISLISSSLQNRIRVHFNRHDFIVFIIIITDVSKTTINKLKKLYLKINDVIISHFFERFLTLNEYYIKQLFSYLNERFIVY